MAPAFALHAPQLKGGGNVGATSLARRIRRVVSTRTQRAKARSIDRGNPLAAEAARSQALRGTMYAMELVASSAEGWRAKLPLDNWCTLLFKC